MFTLAASFALLHLKRSYVQKQPHSETLGVRALIGISLVAQTVKCLPTMWETWVRSWVGKILWRRQWHPTPVLLPGESHGRRSLVGYSPWDHKELDTTERLHFTSPQSFNIWIWWRHDLADNKMSQDQNQCQLVSFSHLSSEGHPQVHWLLTNSFWVGLSC